MIDKLVDIIVTITITLVCVLTLCVVIGRVLLAYGVALHLVYCIAIGALVAVLLLSLAVFIAVKLAMISVLTKYRFSLELYDIINESSKGETPKGS